MILRIVWFIDSNRHLGSSLNLSFVHPSQETLAQKQAGLKAAQEQLAEVIAKVCCCKDSHLPVLYFSGKPLFWGGVHAIEGWTLGANQYVATPKAGGR